MSSYNKCERSKNIISDTPRRKPIPNARRNTDNEPALVPQKKTVKKAKLLENRSRKKAATEKPDKERKSRGVQSKNTQMQNTAKQKKQNSLALTPDEEKHREECLEAKANAKRPNEQELFDIMLEAFTNNLTSGKVEVVDWYGNARDLTETEMDSIFYAQDSVARRFLPTKSFFSRVLVKWLEQNNKDFHLRRTFRYNRKKKDKRKISVVIANEILDENQVKVLKKGIAEQFSFKKWLSLVAQNRKYAFVKPYDNAVQAVSHYESRTYVRPENRRFFILDIGPTNSGKTHSGMEALKVASSGVYLGPLRLLAMEAADTLNSAGIPCSLLTGEESHDVEGAQHVASTVEMLDRACRYEVAVIDECQMIADPERGYAWAAAITSINAEKIHLCLAPEAEDLIIGLLERLGEEYEIEYHDRLVPLKTCKPIKYPKGLQSGDALIVFSRKSVQNYAADLSSKGIKTSMVYGALPYEVRKEEVRKFAEGETQVVVATDAIGMGLNLPVRRVVFAELEKFDGKSKRQLTTGEIKQIAGRAGRYGKYDVGYVTALNQHDYTIVSAALNEDTPSISMIRLDMPRRISELDVPLCHLMKAWNMTELEYPYLKRDLSQQIELARRIKDLPNDFVAEAIEIPFASGSKYVPLDDMWEKAVRGIYLGFNLEMKLYKISTSDRLQYLEDAAKVADLFYGLAKRYGTPQDLALVDKHRKKISECMIEKLKEHPDERLCSWCGQSLSNNCLYPMHRECYEEYKELSYSYVVGY